MGKKITRREQREMAFMVLFEWELNGRPMDEVLTDAKDARDLEPSEYILSIIGAFFEHMEEIDAMIEQYLVDWSKNRLSKAALAILRLAVCEIKYDPAIPESVSINEAVELAKVYSGEEDAAFINGVLGSLVRESGE